MAEPPAIERALAAAVDSLRSAKREFALVGGLAVSVRAEVRFTRDVDLAVRVADDADAERLMTDRRLQDQIDARKLVACNPGIDLVRVRDNLSRIRERGYDRGEDLERKLAKVIAEAGD